MLRLGTGLSPLHLVGCGVSACTGVWEEHWFPLWLLFGDPQSRVRVEGEVLAYGNPPLAQTRPCFSFLGWVELTPKESRVVQEMPQPAAAGVYRLGGAGGNPTPLCWDQSYPRPPAACCDCQPPGEAEPPSVTSCALPEGFHCLPFYFGETNLQPPPLPALGVQNPFAAEE